MNESFWKLVLDPGVKNVHFIGKDMLEITYYDGAVNGAFIDSGSKNWEVFHQGKKCQT